MDSSVLNSEEQPELGNNETAQSRTPLETYAFDERPQPPTMAPTAPVLYIEDEADDAYFMERAFEQAGVTHPLTHLRNGKDAIDYLNGHGRFADRKANPLPCLVLLDLKLPICSGFQVLEWIRQTPELRHLKVVVISSSGQLLDIQLAQKIGISDYIVKPQAPSKLIDIVRRIKTDWLV